jgi:hypothetical protein
MSESDASQRGLRAALGVAGSAVRKGAKPVLVFAFVSLAYSGAIDAIGATIESKVRAPSASIGTSYVPFFTPRASGCPWGPPAPPAMEVA